VKIIFFSFKIISCYSSLADKTRSVCTEGFGDVVEIISNLMNQSVSQAVFPHVYLIGLNPLARLYKRALCECRAVKGDGDNYFWNLFCFLSGNV